MIFILIFFRLIENFSDMLSLLAYQLFKAENIGAYKKKIVRIKSEIKLNKVEILLVIRFFNTE